MSEQGKQLDKVFLTYEQAVSYLPEGPYIHTYRGVEVGIPIGADWARDMILAALRIHRVEITGPFSQAMGHGMAFHDDMSWVMVETVRRTDSEEAVSERTRAEESIELSPERPPVEGVAE